MKDSIERFKDTVNGNGPSTFFWDCIGYMHATTERWHSEGLPADIKEGGYNGQWSRELYDYFGLDWVNFAPVNYYFYPGFEPALIKDEGTTEIVLDEKGVIMRRFKTSLSMPQFLEYPVKDEKSYNGILYRLNAGTPERWDPNLWSDWKDETKNLRTPIGIFIIGFFAVIRELMGVEEGLIAFCLNPDMVKQILKDHCNFCIELIKRTVEKTRVDFCYIWEDMSYKNGILISPKHFDEFISPEASRFIKAVRGFGIDTCIVDSDGDTNQLIPLYISCGVNGFLPFEVQAGMDIRDVRKKYPGLIIAGGIDKRAIAEGGMTLKREIEERVKPMIEQGKYIPSLDHQAHPEMSLANYKKYVEEVKNIL